MLLFISFSQWKSQIRFRVSIHLMLLFIQLTNAAHHGCPVSIHLMLLFIREAFKDQTTVLLFQYISCYSLSPRNCDVTGTQSSFNTSHVTLYLGFDRSILEAFLFQYISCYSLSVTMPVWVKVPLVSIHLMLLFIPCRMYLKRTHEYVSIHLMLLFIAAVTQSKAALTGFNTSHVTLYPSAFWYSCSAIAVSIHLMLLFIGDNNYACIRESIVSIHLMLLFIQVPCIHIRLCCRFNTSHVTLYPLHDIFKTGKEKFQYISCYSLSGFSGIGA